MQKERAWMVFAMISFLINKCVWLLDAESVIFYRLENHANEKLLLSNVYLFTFSNV